MRGLHTHEARFRSVQLPSDLSARLFRTGLWMVRERKFMRRIYVILTVLSDGHLKQCLSALLTWASLD
jgi:hypothetical protein